MQNLYCINSDRLKLIPLTHQQVLLLQNKAMLREFEQQLDVIFPDDLINEAAYINELQEILIYYAKHTKLYPDLYQWHTNWQIILNSEKIIIGNIGFHHYPNDYGETNVGYRIGSSYQNNGYASEALQTLADWGFASSILKTIYADTPLGNYASQKVLAKAGFKLTDKSTGNFYYKLNKMDRQQKSPAF